jgi:hypothetical protein
MDRSKIKYRTDFKLNSLLAERVPNLYLTKLLKLLYIIDETAVIDQVFL